MGEFLINNVALVLLFLASGVMLVWPELSRLAGGVAAVGTLEATRLMNQSGTLVLDVRDDHEFASGHLPRAKNIPLRDLGKRLEEIAKFKDKPVIVSCRTGARSASACRTLRKAGFGNVHNLGGGVVAWTQANLPMER